MCSGLNSKVLKYGLDRLYHYYSKPILKTLLFGIIGASSYTKCKKYWVPLVLILWTPAFLNVSLPSKLSYGTHNLSGSRFPLL